MNKENIEPKNQNLQSDIEAADGYKMYFEKNFGHDIPEHRKNGFLDGCRYKDNTTPTQPPAISSNEGETVEQAIIDAIKKVVGIDNRVAALYNFTEVKKICLEYAGQSQHSYTEATCKKCTLQSGNISYSESEVLAIIEQVKEKCADEATVFLPSHYALHGTKNIDKKSITNIDFKYLLK